MISLARKEKGFVYHPNPKKSEFLKNINSGCPLPDIKEQLLAIRRNFQPATHYQQIIAIKPPLYAFAEWLALHKNEVKKDKVFSKASGLQKLPEEVQVKIWDQLFYQVLEIESEEILQACLQLLIANYVIQELSDTDFEDSAKAYPGYPASLRSGTDEDRIDWYLQRLADSDIVLPECFASPTLEEESEKDTSGFADKNVLEAFETAASNEIIEVWRSLHERIVQLNNIHFALRRKAQQEFQRKYQAALKEILGGKEECEIRKISLEEEFQKRGIPRQFEYLKPLNREFYCDRLSKEDQLILEREGWENSSISRVTSSLRRRINKLESANRRRKANPQRLFMLNGTTLSPVSPTSGSYATGFSFDWNSKSNRGRMFLVLDVGQPNATIDEATFQLNLGEGEPIQSSDYEIIGNHSNLLTLALFPEQNFQRERIRDYELQGNIVLMDQREGKIKAKGNGKRQPAQGRTQFKIKGGGGANVPMRGCQEPWVC